MTDPHAEVACLIRDTFSDEDLREMGLDCIITMHKPISHSNNISSLLGVRWSGPCKLDVFNAKPAYGSDCVRGFAFSDSQAA
jgi:hypothetical protein